MTTLATHTTAMVAAASGVDTAMRNGEHACNTWARFCAKRMMGNKPSLTLDDVSATLVAACMAVATPKQKREIGTVGSLAKNGFATAYGWFRMLARIEAAGMLPQLGEAKSSLWALGKSVPAQQPKAPRKGKAKGKTVAKGKGSDAGTVAPQATVQPSVPAPIGFKECREFLVSVRKGKNLKAIQANEAHLSVIIAEASNIARMLETARKAQAKAKAIGKVKAPKATARKAA